RGGGVVERDADGGAGAARGGDLVVGGAGRGVRDDVGLDPRLGQQAGLRDRVERVVVAAAGATGRTVPRRRARGERPVGRGPLVAGLRAVGDQDDDVLAARALGVDQVPAGVLGLDQVVVVHAGVEQRAAERGGRVGVQLGIGDRAGGGRQL